jgi:hypothetical protein
MFGGTRQNSDFSDDHEKGSRSGNAILVKLILTVRREEMQISPANSRVNSARWRDHEVVPCSWCLICGHDGDVIHGEYWPVILLDFCGSEIILWLT